MCSWLRELLFMNIYCQFAYRQRVWKNWSPERLVPLLDGAKKNWKKVQRHSDILEHQTKCLKWRIFEYLCTGSAAYEPTVNEVQVPVLNRELCNDWLVQLNVTEGMICAGYSEGGKDACQVNIILLVQLQYAIFTRKILQSKNNL